VRRPPNVLYVVWDDAGIGTWSAFGGLAETPAMKWLAGRGLRYGQWHTNALPSATRCCLLTGRNDEPAGRSPEHSVIIPPEAGTLAEILGRGGYRTYCVGQWHHAPPPGAAARTRVAASPRRTWPLGRGFDRYYGFLGRQTSPWYPDLVYDNQHVDPPYPPADGYHVSQDLADMAMEFIGEGLGSAPERPWLCYLSFGASGAPSAAPQEWADHYRGRFDMGYDRYRELVLRNMKRLGVVPEGTGLALADDRAVRPWRSLTEEQRRAGSRLAEASVGLCSYTDHQVGRLLHFLEDSGQLDDTIVVACSANATSADEWPSPADRACPPGGSAVAAGWPGQAGPLSSGGGHAAGWAWAFRTPYSLARQESLGGSAASPLIISWPPETRDVAGGVRDQYHHAVDIVPTILDCAGVDPPQLLRGRLQAPMHGVSMRYTFAAPGAPSARRTQVYRTPGWHAVYHDGWKAAAGDGAAGSGRWELYHVSADRSEIRNVAARHPERVAELAALCEAAAPDRRPAPVDLPTRARAGRSAPVTPAGPPAAADGQVCVGGSAVPG
jgi:arylsulfatase A-like enzyme